MAKNNQEEDSNENGGTIFAGQPLNLIHNLYLVGHIGEPKEYTQWFQLIRNAKENEVVYFHINSGGGNAFTTLQLIRCMHESKGMIIASVEGLCASAATLIFLNAQRCEISEHSMFLFHNFSGISMGKGGEMLDHVTASRKWSVKLFHTFYKHFLSVAEIDLILDNKDIWMDSEEVTLRLKKRSDILEAEQKEFDNRKIDPSQIYIPEVEKKIKKQRKKNDNA